MFHWTVNCLAASCQQHINKSFDKWQTWVDIDPSDRYALLGTKKPALLMMTEDITMRLILFSMMHRLRAKLKIRL